MNSLLLTSLGIGIACFNSWIAEQRPDIFLSSNFRKEDDRISQHSLIGLLSLVFIAGLGLNFYGLSVGNFEFVEKLNYGVLVSLSATAAYFDLRYQLIPNRILLVGFIVWVVSVYSGNIPFVDSVLAGMAAALLFMLIRLVGYYFFEKAGMGMGDIKLIFLVGLFLQWQVLWVIYLAILTGGILGISVIIFQKHKRNSRIPFAPFIWVAVSLSIFILSFDEFIALWT
jgi:leader peptidase (prepilin peptidase)/N-methyltransferase